MDLDLEIISEEGDCPDPLFNSIMNAMNSMKEATADKIYQKIQKEGETNYSKPQVDRALASALEYGIFEVRNNRYRVRDDILDDEDTVYWKWQKAKEESPFQLDDGINPERDNQRFRKITVTEQQECPQCGRVKRPLSNKLESVKDKSEKKEGTVKPHKGQRKTSKSNKKSKENVSSRKVNPRRRTRLDSHSEERQAKVRKISGIQENQDHRSLHYKEDQAETSPKEKKVEGGITPEVRKFDSTDESDLESPSSPSEDEQIFVTYRDNKQVRNRHESNYGSHFLENVIEAGPTRAKMSTHSFVSESYSEKSATSFISSPKDPASFMENLPCTSRRAANKEPTPRNQFLDSGDLYGKQYGRQEVDQTDRKSDWMGYADQPQGNIIETKNVLTIEPIDSMGFKSQEQASYIS